MFSHLATFFCLGKNRNENFLAAKIFFFLLLFGCFPLPYYKSKSLAKGL